MAGFLATGVLMPLITVVAVSTSGEGILGLARRVGPRFGTVMPLAVYLAIGPLYAIARVTTSPTSWRPARYSSCWGFTTPAWPCWCT